MRQSNYDKYPFIQVEESQQSCHLGWNIICRTLNSEISGKGLKRVVIECYQGVDDSEVQTRLQEGLQCQLWIHSSEAFKIEREIIDMVYPDVTDDRIFGYMSRLSMHDFLDQDKVSQLRKLADNNGEGTVVVYGPGASLIFPEADMLVYADMSRWEIQQRMRRNTVNNLGVRNKEAEFSALYKQGFFVDWRVCDRLKKELMHRWDYLLDTNTQNCPKLVAGKALLKGLQLVASRPFRVVPFFDPGPWGGQWMKEVCDLDRSAANYAWCFDCVPEENSLLLGFGDVKVEIPALNLVFSQTDKLLGPKVHARFGDEFPIRFDFLDTMEGGNLSLQVHPLTEYIQQHFGMPYTQDESYYFLDAAEGSKVYLGLKEGVEPETMIRELEEAQQGGAPFNADKHVQKWSIQKHDHVSIPAGTVHCSCTGSMVLEISATPYIFTFKLWDWGRLGLDGKPRPINITHGEKVIQWNRTASWVEKNILNLVEPLGQGDGWREERTGLSELQFIETRRHWFTGKVPHHTGGIVNVLNLVQGREAIVESPSGAFSPFIVHFAETFIVPAAVGAYSIRPYGEAEGTECATVKAFIRI